MLRCRKQVCDEEQGEKEDTGEDERPFRFPRLADAEDAVQSQKADDDSGEQGEVQRNLEENACDHVQMQGDAPAQQGDETGISAQCEPPAAVSRP